MLASRARTRPFVVVAGVIICVLLIIFRIPIRSTVHPVIESTPVPSPKPYTVEKRVRQYGGVVRPRLEPFFQKAGVPYPPTQLVFIGLKQEKRLEIYAAGKDGKFHFIRSYPMLAASGHAGPKLQEGDLQVPEGLYRIESLNPNSLFHLSLRVNYPNEFDRANAASEHRENLDSDIMIHGDACSIGCMAMGDEAAEDLFVLAALTGIDNIQVILSPVDFRIQNAEIEILNMPPWIGGLYEQVKKELKKYPAALETFQP